MPRASRPVVAVMLILGATWFALARTGTSVPLETHAALFARLHPRTAPRWRTYIAADDPLAARFTLMAKSASLFGVPSVADYEPQTARRFAEFLVMLRIGAPMRSLNAFYYPVHGWMGPGLNRNLLDLAAARYLVVDGDADPTRVLTPPPDLIDRSGDVRVYENPSALPRALWVPRVEVVPSSTELLRRLALRWVDPWQAALVEAPPPSGFLGEEAPGPPATPAQVTFVRDDPEAIALDVRAPQRGFLLLADQHHAGWYAAVDGRPAPILRANYAFRAVEVPAGTSRIAFIYRPRAVVVGAAVSAAALLAVLIALLLTRPSPPGRRAPAGSIR